MASRQPFPDPDLPPAEVAVEHRQTGGSSLTLVLVTFALVPFVQAVAAAFGAKLAGAMDSATRGAVRRLLRRVHDQPAARRGTHPTRVSVALTDQGSGTRVLLDDDLPAEAVAQLVRMALERSDVADGAVIWLPKGDRAGKWYVESEGRLRAVWDSDVRQWHPADEAWP